METFLRQGQSICQKKWGVQPQQGITVKKYLKTQIFLFPM